MGEEEDIKIAKDMATFENENIHIQPLIFNWKKTMDF